MRPTARFSCAFVAIFAGGIANAACGGRNTASDFVKAPEYNPKDQTKCSLTKSQARPLIVEWPAGDRLQLETKIRGGIVAVRYLGCEMVVLERCSVQGKYSYLSGTRKTDTVVMTDANDLYASLPVGAARLEGKLQHSGKLTVSMNLVGRYEAQRTSVRANELVGECAGATHFVYGVTVGAFDFYAGADAKVGGSVGIGSLGAGGHSSAERETLTKDGDVNACAKATTQDQAPPEGCGALLRLEVVPLSDAAAYTPPQTTTAPVPTSTAAPPLAGTGPAVPIAPMLAAPVQPILVNMGQSEAQGGQPDGSQFAGQFAAGETLEQTINIKGNGCYTIVAASIGIQQLDIALVVPQPPMMQPITVAQSSGTGPNATLGGKATGCWRNPTPIAAVGKVILKATSGQGLAAAQVFSK